MKTSKSKSKQKATGGKKGITAKRGNSSGKSTKLKGLKAPKVGKLSKVKF